MYEAHFAFNKRPFSLSPDTGLFVNLDDHKRCLSLLMHVLDTGEGFLKVIGEVGTGKTILCRKLLRYLENDKSKNFYSVYIPNPMLSPVGLYRAVGKELGLDLSQQQDNDALLSHITERILALAESNKTVVVIVDESQSLPAETLEALRLITNLETEEKKLIQIILFGQTELDDLLNQEQFRQLRQRITFSHYLSVLNQGETKRYVEYRLSQSGYNGPELFSDMVIKKLHRATKGVPRMINVLAHKALMAAFSDDAHIVKREHIDRAIKDGKQPSNNLTPLVVLVAALSVIFVAVLAWKLL